MPRTTKHIELITNDDNGRFVDTFSVLGACGPKRRLPSLLTIHHNDIPSISTDQQQIDDSALYIDEQARRRRFDVITKVGDSCSQRFERLRTRVLVVITRATVGCDRTFGLSSVVRALAVDCRDEWRAVVDRGPGARKLGWEGFITMSVRTSAPAQKSRQNYYHKKSALIRRAKISMLDELAIVVNICSLILASFKNPTKTKGHVNGSKTSLENNVVVRPDKYFRLFYRLFYRHFYSISLLTIKLAQNSRNRRNNVERSWLTREIAQNSRSAGESMVAGVLTSLSQRNPGSNVESVVDYELTSNSAKCSRSGGEKRVIRRFARETRLNPWSRGSFVVNARIIEFISHLAAYLFETSSNDGLISVERYRSIWNPCAA